MDYETLLNDLRDGKIDEIDIIKDVLELEKLDGISIYDGGKYRAFERYTY